MGAGITPALGPSITHIVAILGNVRSTEICEKRAEKQTLRALNNAPSSLFHNKLALRRG